MMQFPQFIRNENEFSGQYLEKNTKFLFHHIPKTAGSTLRGILATLVQPDELCPAETVEELKSLSKEQFEQYKLYAGHFSFSAINELLPDAVWITFLREPNERVISHYYNHINNERIPDEWKMRVENNPDWKAYMQTISGYSLEEWVTSSNKWANSITCNRQVQAFVPQDLRVEVEDWSVHDEKLLNIAKENLKTKFAFFGVQEYFDLSFLLFSATFGLMPLTNSSGYTTNTNTKKKFGSRYEVGERLTALIAERNSMDWELYKFGEQLFLSRISNMFSGYIQADRKERLDKWLQQDISQRGNAKETEWDIDSTLGVKGFYALEKTRLGQKFRWTGADDVSVIEINKSLEIGREYRVKIQSISCFHKSVLDSLELKFDGVLVDTPKVKKEWFGSGLTISFDVIPSSFSHYHILEMISGRLSEDALRKDARLIGLAVNTISVKER